ncbi:MAG: HNH endonuclease [Candidatus Nanoarchaeia archaeon]|jgi:hypothetical protein
MNKQILLLIFVLLISKSFSLDCQYTQIFSITQDESFLVYDENQSIIGSPLNITDITAGSQYFTGGTQRNLATLKIHNPYYFDLNVTLNVDVSGSCSTRSNIIKFQIKARDYYLVETDGGWGQTPCTIIINEHTLSYHVDYPFNASESILAINRNSIICKICESGLNCTDNGGFCSNSNQCGGGYCIEGICNNQSLCYNDDCKCSLDKIQCSTNDKCVIKTSLEVGSKPICRVEECKTNYINQSTGICANEPKLDGQQCEFGLECSGSYCIKKRCNTQLTCYNNDCECSTNEIQKLDNTDCVLMGSAIIDMVPLSGDPRECKTNYINNETGRCSKTPETIRNENLSLIGLLILTGIIIFYIITRIVIKNKKDTSTVVSDEANAIATATAISEGEKRKTIELDLSAIEISLSAEKEKYEQQKDLLNSYNKQILNASSVIKDAEKELNKLKDIKTETELEKKLIIEKQTSLQEEIKIQNNIRANLKKQKEKTKELIESENLDIQKKTKELRLRHEKLEKYTEVRKSTILHNDVWEWRNPNMRYYPCYVNHGKKTDILIHRDQAEKKIFKKYVNWFNENYLNKKYKDLVVHHIDANPDNYRINNLAVITQMQHNEIKPENIIFGNLKSGIKELKRLNIKQPHLNI